MEILFNSSAKSGAPAADKSVKEVNIASFVDDVIEASMTVPVVVDFWAPWCEPCKALGPMLEKLVNETGGAVRLVKVNVDKNQELAAQMRIQSIPAVYAFKGGRPVDGFVGAQPDSKIRAFIQRLTGGQLGKAPEVDELLAEAKTILAAGDSRTALQIYQQILSVDRQNPAAIAGSLRCLIQAGEINQAKQGLAALPPDLAKHAEIAAVRTAIELIEQANQAGPAADLRRAVAANPDDHQARFDLAMACFGAGQREAAVDELLELFRRDRNWNDGAARQQLIKLFDAFGPTDPLTVSGRKRLSSLMFA
jgi:putative thioredoxin